MKVLLVRPAASNPLNFFKILDSEPLELEYLHTVLLERGYEDYLYDGLIEITSITKTIRREKPDVIAVSGYITQEEQMMDLCRQAKSIRPEIVTLVGGVHVQLNPERFFDDSVDYILRSESCESFGELMDFIDARPDVSLDQINGLCYKKEGVWKSLPLLPTDINLLPIPDRTFFQKNKQHYRYLDLKQVAILKTAVSCPYRCNFCYCALLHNGQYQARNLDLVMEELKSIDAENILIADDDFLVDAKRIWAFITMVREANLHKQFICYARADFVAQNPKIIQALTAIGFVYFLVGLEAISDDELLGYDKETTKANNEACVAIIHRAGAQCIGLMIAPLSADKNYFDQLYAWVVAQQLKYVTVSIFTPIPGTPIFEEYREQLLTLNMKKWDFLHLVVKPQTLTVRGYYYQFGKLMWKLYRLTGGLFENSIYTIYTLYARRKISQKK